MRGPTAAGGARDPQSVPKEAPAFADVIVGRLVARELVPGAGK